MFVVFSDFLDSGEVMFDRVQVWRVRRQEEKSGPLCGDQLLCFF